MYINKYLMIRYFILIVLYIQFIVFFFLWLLGFLVLFSGIVKVNGYDIMIDIDKVCQSIGFCFQYDILFENMIVEEYF